jgi:hypothetical protein
VADLEWMATGRRGNLLSFFALGAIIGGGRAEEPEWGTGYPYSVGRRRRGLFGFVSLCSGGARAPVRRRDPPLARGQSRARRG